MHVTLRVKPKRASAPAGARVLVAWLRSHAGSIGTAVARDVDADDTLAPSSTSVIADAGQLVPLERLALPVELSGVRGANCAPTFAYPGAAHDLDTGHEQGKRNFLS
ncbi:hypothetical protein [Burkholderia ubonensis]|uniref:Uncharacterized protein n=1 Tax=Burkholderia ubonensis TaxID=101571 RepID=A0AAW3NIC2_9BURK|nr:hypothetical protein [Burkholderia ubonensis]KVT57078.1 hypothetical protein WK53_29990 [Burkholderia ubonensis]